MKKLFSGIIAAIVVSTGIFTFAGCEKEESTETKIIMKADAVGAGVGAAVGAVKTVPTAVTASLASGLTAAAPAWIAAGGVMASYAFEYGAAGSLYKGVALLQSKR